MSSGQNAADVARWASALGGAALAFYGIRRRSIGGAMIAASGGALFMRGATGHWSVKVNGARRRTKGPDTRSALRGSRGLLVEHATTIDRSADELYRFWRNFENLPQFMPHLVSVHQLDERRSHWIAKAPAGRTVEWDAEIINEIPNELIGWRTVDGADVISAGSVRFTPAGLDRGTEVHVRLQYEPPGGKVGAAVAWMLGHDPNQTIQEDVRRFKQLMETGEVPTTAGQPRGRGSFLNYD